MPVRGHYRQGGLTPAPFVNAQVELPALHISTEVEFLADTGAEATTLLHDTLSRLSVSPQRVRSLPRTASVTGIGGDVPCYTTRAIVSLRDDSLSAPHAFDINIDLAPSLKTADLPSLLGRDILNQLRCVFDHTDGEVILVAK